MFSPILDAFVMFSSPNRRRKRVVQEEENFFETTTKNKEREKSTYRRCAPIRFRNAGDLPTVISGVISEYKAAPETNCIKAINPKKAVNNFVAVNCMLFYYCYTRVLMRSTLLRSEKNESHERERFFLKKKRPKDMKKAL